MTNVTTTELVQGAVAIEEGNGLVKELKENWFKKLVLFTLQNQDSIKDNDPSELLKDNFETPYREERKDEEGKPMKGGMPGWYRSNKSTVKGALELGVALVDMDGEVRGKSDIAADIAAAKDPKTTDEKVMDLVSTISKLLDKGEHTKPVAEALVELGIKATATL